MNIAKIIETGKDMPFDLDQFLVSRGLIQASSGGGKSYAIRKFLEETHGKVQQIVLDSEGEYSTLREKFDYLLIGKGKDVDVQIDIRSAELIANKILELRVSVIIDLYELKPHERKIFVRRFFEALVNIKKSLWHSVLILLDEGDVYAPEKSAGQAESLPAVSDLASRGRKRGQCLVVATQRIAKLNKDVAAELKNKFIGNATQDIDRDRAGKELGFTKKEDVLSLRDLEPGEFFCFGPAITKEITKVKINPVKTTHPEAGKRIGLKPTPPTAKIKAMLSKLADLPKKAEEELREKQDYVKKIRSLEAQLRQKPKPEADGRQVEFMQKRMELRTESVRNDSFNKGLRAEANNHKAEIINYKKTFQIFENRIKNLGSELKQFTIKCSKLLQIELPEIKKVVPKETINRDKLSRESRDNSFDVVSKKDIQGYPKEELLKDTEVNEDGELNKSQIKILEALSKLKPVMELVPRPIVAAYSGFSSTGGGFNNNLSKLRAIGLIDYKSAKVFLTDEGLNKVEIVPGPVSNEELQQMWRNLLSDSQKKILDAIIEIYPDQISRDELAERTGFSNTGGGFNNNLSRMKTMQILDYPEQGYVKATKNVFLE